MTVAYGRYKQVDADFTSRMKSGPQGKVHDAPVTLTVTVTKVAFRDEATGFFIVNTAEGVSVKGNSMFIGEGVKLVVTGKWKNGTGNWPMYIYADKVALAEQGDAIKVLLGSGFLKGVKRLYNSHSSASSNGSSWKAAQGVPCLVQAVQPW